MSPWPGMAPQARPQLSTPRRKPPHKVPSAPRGEKAHTFPPSYYYEARGRANAPQYRAHHFPHRTTRPHQQKRADKAPTNSWAALGWPRAAFAERVCRHDHSFPCRVGSHRTRYPRPRGGKKRTHFHPRITMKPAVGQMPPSTAHTISPTAPLGPTNRKGRTKPQPTVRQH